MKLDVCTHVGLCMGCEHWQVDMTPRARSEHGGMQGVVLAAAEAHHAHLAECPGGTEGRVKFQGQWAERPKLSDGKKADGLIAFHPLPRWWVWR